MIKSFGAVQDRVRSGWGLLSLFFLGIPFGHVNYSDYGKYCCKLSILDTYLLTIVRSLGYISGISNKRYMSTVWDNHIMISFELVKIVQDNGRRYLRTQF